MHTISEDDLRLSEHAAEWLLALEEAGDDPQVRAQFSAWLYRSPRHIEEFLLVSALFRKLEQVDVARRIDVQALLAQAAANVVTLSPPRVIDDITTLASVAKGAHPAIIHRLARPAAAIAVTIASIAFIAVSPWKMTQEWEHYATGSGEQRILQLEDGSVLTLNARSDVQVRFSKTTRAIRLLIGDGIFKVAQDPARPFRVYAGEKVIQAVGTEFQVLRRGQQTRIAVFEGRVRITTPQNSKPDSPLAVTNPPEIVPTPYAQLGAGEQISISADGELTQAPQGKRRLVFTDDRLEDVAETFNFYNRDLPIQVQDPVAAERRLTGTFNIDAPQSLILILSAEPDLSIERDGARFLIRSRSTQPKRPPIR